MTSTIEGVCPVLAVPFTSDGEVDCESFASLAGLAEKALALIEMVGSNA